MDKLQLDGSQDMSSKRPVFAGVLAFRSSAVKPFHERTCLLHRDGTLSLPRSEEEDAESLLLHEKGTCVRTSKSDQHGLLVVEVSNQQTGQWWEFASNSDQQFAELWHGLGIAVNGMDAAAAAAAAGQPTKHVDSLERHQTKQAAQARQYLQSLAERMQLIELVAGMGLLNFLLILILNSSPGHLEAWLFIGSVDILIGWGLLVRFEQLVFRPGSARARQDLDAEEEDDAFDEDEDVRPPSSLSDSPLAAGHKLKARRAGNLPLAPGPFPPYGDVDSGQAGYIRHPAHTWAPCQVSSVGLLRAAAGAPADSDAAELFRLVCVDVYRGDARIDRVAAEVLIADDQLSAAASDAPGAKALAPWPAPLPHLLVVNFQVQRAGMAVFQTTGSPGYSLVLFFEPGPALLAAMRLEPRSPAVNLLCAWLAHFASDESVKERLKLKATVLNPSTCGIPSWALKYNAQSCTLAKSNKMSRFPGRTMAGLACDVLECDVDMREWNLLCRQGVNSILPVIDKLDFTLALTLQGEAQVPEQVLGVARLNFLDPNVSAQW